MGQGHEQRSVRHRPLLRSVTTGASIVERSFDCALGWLSNPGALHVRRSAPGHSSRSAMIGSIDAARIAGMQQADNDTSVTIAATAASVVRSRALTWKSNVANSGATISDSAVPDATPIAVSRNP